MTKRTFRLDEALLARNMSIAELSSLTAIPTRTLARWRRHDNGPRVGDERIERIAEALHFDIGWLNGLDVPMEAADDGRSGSQDK